AAPTTQSSQPAPVAANKPPASAAVQSAQSAGIWTLTVLQKAKKANPGSGDGHNQTFGPIVAPPPKSEAQVTGGKVSNYKGCDLPCSVGSTITFVVESEAHFASHVYRRDQ